MRKVLKKSGDNGKSRDEAKTNDKQRNARGDFPITLRRCFNPKSHAGTDAQLSSLCHAV